MRDRAAQILKLVCLGLAALLLVQFVKVAYRANPLANTRIPDVPALPPDTNAPLAIAGKTSGKPGTNAPITAANSNAPIALSETNAVAHKKSKPTDSNASPVIAFTETNAINTNLPAGTVAAGDTNGVSAPKVKSVHTNTASVTLAAELSATNGASTNSAATTGTNIAAAKTASATNDVASEATRTNGTNIAMAKASGAKRPPTMPPQMIGGPMMGGPGGAKAARLAPEVQARVDRVVESEIFTPVIRPMPMALLGIAGNVAFLRSPSGQTGLVKEGDTLGEIKLLRIGINRVLVEQDGQQKELMIFSGFGGESLVSKPTATSDETTKK